MPPRQLPKPDYPKELTTPIEVVYPKPPTFLTDNHEQAFLDYKKVWQKLHLDVTVERLKKMSLLKKFYGLEDNYEDLVNPLLMKVCFDNINGFQMVERKKSGRGKSWDFIMLYLLWYDVQQLIKDKPRSSSEACRVLCNKPFWKKMLIAQKKDSLRTKERPQKILADRYSDAEKSSAVRFIKKAAAKLSHNDSNEMAYELYTILHPDLSLDV